MGRIPCQTRTSNLRGIFMAAKRPDAGRSVVPASGLWVLLWDAVFARGDYTQPCACMAAATFSKPAFTAKKAKSRRENPCSSPACRKSSAIRCVPCALSANLAHAPAGAGRTYSAVPHVLRRRILSSPKLKRVVLISSRLFWCMIPCMMIASRRLRT